MMRRIQFASLVTDYMMGFAAGGSDNDASTPTIGNLQLLLSHYPHVPADNDLTVLTMTALDQPPLEGEICCNNNMDEAEGNQHEPLASFDCNLFQSLLEEHNGDELVSVQKKKYGARGITRTPS